jgi:cytochrome c oxidase subunit IV
MASDETSTVQVIPVDKAKTNKLWKLAGILAIVTFIEYIFAFTMERGYLLYAIFVGLTLVKAFYIVAEFMHLRHEVKTLIWSIMIPVIFVIWLIIALLVEGGSILLVR